MDKHKIEMWQRAALEARLKASSASDPTTEKFLLEVAEQYDGLINRETTSILRAKTGSS